MRLRRAIVVTTLAAVTSVTVTSCGVSVEDLTLPKPNPASGGYTITASFENALNLPTDAKVKIAGNDIGTVNEISTSNYKATIAMQIRKDVELPEGTTAELRQATPLGDVFVSLTLPPADQAGPPIKDGGKLSEANTKAGATVEDLLSQASLMINGGALTKAVEILNQVSTMVSGKDQALIDVLDRLTSMIETMNGRTDALDGTLDQTTELMNTIGNHKKELGDVADSLPGLISVMAENNQTLGDVVRKTSVATDALGDFAGTSTDSMNTLLDSSDKIMTAIDGWDTKLGGVMDQLKSLEPKLDDSTESTGLAFELVVGSLSIGALYDRGSKVPDMQDLNLMVISMTYVLQKVYSRYTGGQR